MRSSILRRDPLAGIGGTRAMMAVPAARGRQRSAASLHIGVMWRGNTGF
jgi:hypothetical protein